MAKNEISDYDETDSGNTDISGITLSDATLIDQLDNIARAQMGALKRWFKSSLFRLRDSTDQTKLLAFDLSGLPTGETTTVVVPASGGTLATTDANTFTANQTITSTDAGATAGPALEFYRNSASPASNDILGKILFNGEDSAGNTQEYASIQAVISDATSTTEDGALAFYTTVAGARTLIATMGPETGVAGRGTATNDSAAAGFIGQFVSASATTGTLATGTDTNVTSIALTAGDWDITAGYAAGGTGTPSVTDVWVSINTSSASSVNTAGQSSRIRGFTMTDPIVNGAIGPLRVSITSSTTYYLNTTCAYTGGGATFAVTGILRARRIR